jgi:hypothetical protein
MRLRRWLMVAPIAGAIGLGLTANSLFSANEAKKLDDPKAAVTLPITNVVLFNSGVGYFARSGEVEGEARVDLTFPETDINDLLKSMTLQDFNGGNISSVSYDSHEPVTRTLASFAINLNGQPTLGDILRQTRGEKIEIVMQPGNTTQPGNLQGTILGLEHQKVPVGTAQIDVEMLNISTAEGLRSVKMMDVQRVRFTNPVLENELKRALDTLALSHDSLKKSVQLNFSGDGKRKVKVGYVIEAPIWKTSYRLVLDKDGKPYLQGWAIVENPTDEDWGTVKMALVSGRPISFKMDLYNPLYIQRPTVEPELFASLRPQAYEGGFRAKDEKFAAAPAAPPAAKPSMAAMAGAPAPGGFGGGKGENGAMALRDGARKADKQYAEQLGREMGDRMDLGSVASSATASKLGDFFQYVIDHPVNLGRQKSALLPIVGKDIDGARVSIYNPGVQVKHPLLGLRFKNTTGVHLSQGPVTVFEGSTYAGDARILDVTPNDERLITYAVDLGTEVIPQNPNGSSRITNVKSTKGIVSISRRNREEKVYKISNKSDVDRTLIIEHPNRTNQQFKLVESAKPVEELANVYRFETKVEAGKSAEYKVIEERDQGEQIVLSNAPDDTIRFVMNLSESSPTLKVKLADALKVKAVWDGHRRELQQIGTDIQRITADQDRIRKNLRETPKEAEVYQDYLKKLSAQEKEMDALTAKQKALMTQEFEARKAFDNFLVNLND